MLAAGLPVMGLDLRRAVIRLQPGATAIEKKAAEVIAQEVEKRTQIRLELNTGGPSIAIGRGSGPAEGFSLTVVAGGVSIRGNEDRGVIFGAGYFLRQLNMFRQYLDITDWFIVCQDPSLT